MSYTLPRVLVEQEFTQAAIFADKPLPALVVGPNYKLLRYAVDAEKNLIDIGSYDPDSDVSTEYPNKPAGGVVDQNYVKVYLEDVEAQYFPHSVLGTATDTVAKVAIPGSSPTAYYSNRLRSTDGVNFKTNGTFDRDAVFSDRDVAVGDIVEITDGSDTLKSKVTGFVAEVDAAVIATGANVSTNAPTQVAVLTPAPVYAGTLSDPSISITNDTTAYYGYINSGVVTDTYTVSVTTAGSALSDLRFSISSAAGVFATKTNQALQTVSADADILVIDDAVTVGGTNAVRLDFTGLTATDFLVGHAWTVTPVAAVTRRNPVTTDSTYSGSVDLTYHLKVVRGGPFYNGSNPLVCARVEVTSTDVDSSGPVNVSSDTYFSVGTKGVVAKFSAAVSGGGLVLGDTYTIDVTAAQDAEIQTLVIEDSLPDWAISATDVSLKLYAPYSSVSLPEIRDVVSSDVNWETSSTEITLKSGAFVKDSALTKDSVAVELPVKSANVFVEYRALLTAAANSVSSVASTSDVEAALGTIDPDNQLAQGVYLAALNAAGVPVYYIGVATDDLSGYLAALGKASLKNNVYGVVPLTFDRQIKDAVVAHVNAMSTPENAKWRVTWLSESVADSGAIYSTKTNGSNWTATVTDDPLTSGTQYKLVTASGATFITDGVRPGDIFRTGYKTDVVGDIVYDEYVVDSVRTQTTLVLATALDAAITPAAKFEIYRTYSKDEQASNVALVAAGYSNRRVRLVFPDYVKSNGTVLNGYFVAAALSGLRSGVVPHQGLTNIELLGFDDVSRVNEFSEEQLNVMAESGVWIVTQATVGATPYSRHQLTTDVEGGFNTSEDSITTNVDSLSYAIQGALDPFIGVYNRNPYAILLIKDATHAVLLDRQTNTFTTRAGNQLNGFTIDKLEANATFKGKVDMEITLDVPGPINNITTKFIV